MKANSWEDAVFPAVQDSELAQGSAPSAFGAAAPLTQTLYLTEAGDSSAISVNDLHQGQIGDCFLISSIGELALDHPSAITNMIHLNPNGTETVTLYIDRRGTLPGFGSTAFRPVSVTVTNVFPSYSVNNGATQGVANGNKEIWAQVLEKAVATLEGGYGAISHGGNPTLTMEELTGHAATYLSPAALTVTNLQSFIAAGDLITFDTPNKSNLPYNLVGNHAYMFEKITGTGAAASIQLGNPWGVDQPSLIPLSQVAKAFAEINVGRFA